MSNVNNFIGFVDGEREPDGRYKIYTAESVNNLIRAYAEPIHRGVIARYRDGDRVLCIRQGDETFIIGGLAPETYVQGRPPITVKAKSRRNEGSYFDKVSPLIQDNPQQDEDIEVVIRTDKPRFHDTESNPINIWGSGDWRMELRVDGLYLIRIREKDKTGPESKQVKQDGWVFYSVPILAPDAFYGIRGFSNTNLPILGGARYHTVPSAVLGMEFRVEVILPPPAGPTFDPVLLQRTSLPHQHRIPTLNDEINLLHLVYRDVE